MVLASSFDAVVRSGVELSGEETASWDWARRLGEEDSVPSVGGGDLRLRSEGIVLSRLDRWVTGRTSRGTG